MTAPVYARTHLTAIKNALATHLTSAQVPDPHPRLPWADKAAAITAITDAIYAYAASDKGSGATLLYELMYPVNLWDVIDQLRNAPPGDPLHPRMAYNDIHHGPTEPESWFAEVGFGIAGAFDPHLVDSIKRMGMRLRVQFDNPVRVEYSDLDKASLGEAAKAELTTADLVASRPLDRVLADVLATPGIVHSIPQKGRRPPDDTPGKPFLSGLRIVEYQWLGSEQDRALWNWIRVTSPPHPTAEDVAYTLYTNFEQHEAPRSDQAFRIFARPPYFRVPPETASRFKDAEKFRPAEPPQIDLSKTRVGTVIQMFPSVGRALAGVHVLLKAGEAPDIVTLARSGVADEIALAQAPRMRTPPPDAAHALERARIQLEFLRERLNTWNLAGWLDGPSAFVERRRRDVGDLRAFARWSPVIVAQERTLKLAASELAQILNNLTAQGLTAADAKDLGPTLEVIRAYAAAAAVSHLPVDASTALTSARRQRDLLPVAFAEEKIRVARLAIADQRAAQIRTGLAAEGAAKTMEALPTLIARAAQLRAKAARGEVIDPDVVAQLDADANETTLRARLLTLDTETHGLQKRIEEIGLTTENWESGYITAWGQTDVLRKEIKKWFEALDAGKKRAREFASPTPAAVTLTEDEKRRRRGESAFIRSTGAHRLPGHRPAPKAPEFKPTDAQQRAEMLQTTVSQIEVSMATFAETLDIQGMFEWAEKQIADKKLSDAIWSIAKNLGIAIITGQVAGLIVAGFRTFALAREAMVVGRAIAEARQASVLWAGFELVTHAGLATLSQRAMGEKGGIREFAENALAIKLTTVVLRPFQKFLTNPQGVAQEVHTWAQLARKGGKLAARATLEIAGGIAASGLARSITHFDQMEIAGGEEWVVQGIALVANKFIHQRMVATNERLKQAFTLAGERSGLKELQDRVSALERRALDAQRRPSRTAALEQLAERRKLLNEEQHIYRQLAAQGIEVPASKRLAAEFEMLGGEFVEVPMRLGGLRPVVEGEIYEGTTKQIQAAFAAAEKIGTPIKASFDENTGRWRIESGTRTIEIHDMAWTPRLKAPAPGAGAPAKPGAPAQPPANEYEIRPGESLNDVRRRLFDQRPNESLEDYRARLKALEGDVEHGALMSGHTEIFDKLYGKLLAELDVDIVKVNELRDARAKLQTDYDSADAEYRHLRDKRVDRIRSGKARSGDERASAAEQAADTRKRLKNAEIKRLDDEIADLARRGSARSAKYEYRDLGRVPPCFVPGTLVKTPAGDRAIETIRRGDLVLAWNFGRGVVEPRPIAAVHHNWSDTVIDVDLPRGRIRTTRSHPFWSDSADAYVPADRLTAGNALRSIDGSVNVHAVSAHPASTITLNLEVDGLHCFYVGADGVLVHNGGAEDYGSLDRHLTRIYAIVEQQTGNIIYIGKTLQGDNGDVQTRFEQHLKDKPHWAERMKDPARAIEPMMITEGHWTKFETAVWETHHIFEVLRQGMKLENVSIPLTEETFRKYKKNFRGC